MCGIVCAFDLKEKRSSLRPKVLEMSKKVRHRGPDWNGIFDSGNLNINIMSKSIISRGNHHIDLFSYPI